MMKLHMLVYIKGLLLQTNSKQSISHSSLIGKNKNDNLLNSVDNNYYYQNINFSEIIQKTPALNFENDKYYENQTDPSKYEQHDPDFTKLFDGATYNTETGQYVPVADEILSKIGIQIPEAFRVYNNFGISKRGSITAIQKVENEIQKDSLENNSTTNEITYTYNELSTQGIYLMENATQNMTIKRVGYRFLPVGSNNYTYFTTAVNYSTNNVLWFWAMQDYLASSGSIFDQLLDNLFKDSTKTLYLNLKITYSVSSCTSEQTVKENEEAKFILYSGKFSTKGPAVKNVYNWKSSADDVEQFGREDDSFTYGNETITLTNPSGSGDKATSTVPIWNLKNITNTIKGAYLRTEEKEVVNNGETTIVKEDIYDTFEPRICSGNSTEEYSNLIQTKNISIIAQSSQTKPIFGTKTMYAPIFALGIENLNTNASLEKERVNIFQVEVLISNDQGNFSYSLNKVDFLYDLNVVYNNEKAAWTKWASEESGVKIYFILENLETDESHPKLDTGVVIFYSRSTAFGNKVTASYTVLGDATYAPGNTNGAKIANITNNTGTAA